MSLPSAEVTETEQPLEVLCTELIPDVGGPGKHRGGMSIRRAYRLVEDEAVLQVRADRHTFRPYGLYGGGSGQPSRNRLISGGAERELTAKVTMTPMRRGDVFIHDQPGPGGWGDPLERDPARVLRDVLNELVSVEAARDDYGVILHPRGAAVDEAATARRRAELRTARGWTTPPVVTR
jgi:N-methylhydantoinase B